MKIEFDSLVETVARGAARRYSRRHALSVFSRVLVGGMLVPLLPVDRIARAAESPSGGKLPTGWDKAKAQTKDPTKCDYWRYCAADGYQCACCGGSSDTCPPGTDPSPSSWIGTCFNPDDKNHYIIAYRDCCGKGDACQRCPCTGFKGDKPPYITNRNNDTFWCFGAKNMVYHCSGSVVIGKA